MKNYVFNIDGESHLKFKKKMIYLYYDALMNPFEREILRYEKDGYIKDHKRKLKFGLRTYLEKRSFLSTAGVYFYYVDGDATSDSLREFFKDYGKFYDDKGFDSGDKAFFLCTGNCDLKLFRDLKQAMLIKEARNGLKLKFLEKTEEKPVKEIKKVNGEKIKRVKLTPKERTYVWEHPEKYGRICNICSGKIEKLSDLELDHTIPFCEGGTKMALAHRDCNKMKGSKNLIHIQTKMRFKKPKTHK